MVTPAAGETLSQTYKELLANPRLVSSETTESVVTRWTNLLQSKPDHLALGGVIDGMTTIQLVAAIPVSSVAFPCQNDEIDGINALSESRSHFPPTGLYSPPFDR